MKEKVLQVLKKYAVIEMSVGSYAMILAGFVRAAFLTRILGPGPYGSLVLTIGVVDTLYLLTSLEPDGAVIHFTAAEASEKNKAKLSQKITMGYVLSMIRGGLVILLLALLGGVITAVYGGGDQIASLALLYAVAAAFYSIERTSNSFLLGLKAFRSHSYQLTTSAVLIVFFPAVMAPYGVEAALTGFILGHCASMVVSLGLTARSLRNAFGALPFSRWPRWSESRNFLRFCFLSSVNSTANASAQNIDVAIIGLFLPREWVGFYNLGVKFTRMAGLALQPIRNIFFPLVSEEWGRGNVKSVQRRVHRVMMMGALIALPLGAVLYFGSNTIIRLYSGPEYLEAARVMRITVLASIVLCVMNFNRQGLMGINYPEGVLYTSLFGTVLRVAGCFLLVPFYALLGAAWAENMVVLGMNGLGYLLQRRRWSRRRAELILQET